MIPDDKGQAANTSLPKQTTPAPKEEDFKMSVNDNPRANENVYNESMAEDEDTSDIGSEITDGEAS
ncbi:MAG TPA: hypothetical protein VD794_07510 [Flavisolibacter sp.]|nr:hypothetical protein [Flavisolibacter sp.]